MLKTKICQFCDKPFDRQYHKSDKRNKTNPGKFCSQKCHELGKKNSFVVKSFRFDTSKYEFQKPKDNLGKDSFKKEYQIVKAKKFNDRFFKKGIVNEETAYFYGIVTCPS